MKDRLDKDGKPIKSYELAEWVTPIIGGVDAQGIGVYSTKLKKIVRFTTKPHVFEHIKKDQKLLMNHSEIESNLILGLVDTLDKNKEMKIMLGFIVDGRFHSEFDLTPPKKKKEMKITVKDYPATFIFTTTTKLPKFKIGCKIRGKLLLSELEKQKIDSPLHSYDDYIVEIIESDKDTETWHLGS